MSHTVLVVEDDVELCEMMCEALYFSAAPEEKQASPTLAKANIRYSFQKTTGPSRRVYFHESRLAISLVNGAAILIILADILVLIDLTQAVARARSQSLRT